ncbi:MAG: hypothetical protein R3E39_12375 [Anaerolineae bacterium]
MQENKRTDEINNELISSVPVLKTTWYLEIAPTTYPWKLGAMDHSELGLATRAAY